jgi:beta-glucosidase
MIRVFKAGLSAGGRRRSFGGANAILAFGKQAFLAALLLAAPGFRSGAAESAAAPLWKDPSRPVEERAADLVSRMTLPEKARQLCNHGPAIPRLGLPAYDYWNEALHGVARNGAATVFPQAIGMAASWDPALLRQTGDVIATEARAKFRAYADAHNGDGTNYTGLTFWSPNINIVRDPRWGRNQETYGEDPFLTGRLAVAFIRGLQGDDPTYYKAVACAKHFCVHSGPESLRHRFNAEPSERDLHETYLPQFEAAVREGHVGAVMGAYNRLNGRPVCASSELLTGLLRGQWGFDGQVVSDCGAVDDMVEFHKYVPTVEEASALAVKAGCDLSCGSEYETLRNAVGLGLLAEKDLDTALCRDLKVRFRLGLFDLPARVPYSKITAAENETPEHAALALRMARESLVLLKNDRLLPLDRTKLRRIAVIGANADSVPVLLGNYCGVPSHPVNFLAGIRQAILAKTEVVYESGCPLSVTNGELVLATNSEGFKRAVSAGKSADAIVYFGGLDPKLEGEDLHLYYDGFHGGDRTQIELPQVQLALLKALHATGKPVVFVNCSGAAVAMPWVADHIPAILQAWYPGQAGGAAVAEVLFGDANPSGRLPVTFYRSTDDLPAFTNYSMANRTYRYFSGQPLFAFGHGLSYTRFRYESVELNQGLAHFKDTVRVALRVVNAGGRDGAEVVQVYYRALKPSVPQASKALCGFQRVEVAKGASERVEIEIPVERFRYWDVAASRYVVEPGAYELMIGPASDEVRARLMLRVSDEQAMHRQ